LRALAHDLSPIFQVGKGGVNEQMVREIGDALEARELVKVQILNNCTEDKDEVARVLSEGTDAELVQLIGHVVVLYKESAENPRIELP